VEVLLEVKPLVSILIPCFNGAPWLHRSIETALAQTWPNKEIVVLDDGSTDNSLEIIRRYESQVRVATQANGGQNVSRNHLTELSRGEWLVYLDADDELFPDSVEKKMAYADHADAIYGAHEVATFVGTEKTRFTILPAIEFEDAVSAAFVWGFPNTSAFMFRKSALLEAGGWNTAIKNCTDYDLYFRLLLKGKRFRAANDSMSLYRQWSMNQAVYQDPLRKSRTRLQLIWSAAKELEATGRLTTTRKDAFERAAFGVTRTIAQFNREEAVRQHAQLTAWDPGFRPHDCSRSYRLAYRLGGFEFAEKFAAFGRALNPVKKPQPGIDPQSGLPYV
jgi:hypothetical protein